MDASDDMHHIVAKHCPTKGRTSLPLGLDRFVGHGLFSNNIIENTSLIHKVASNRRKHVAFLDAPSFLPPSPYSLDCQTHWYSKEELSRMKQEGKEDARSAGDLELVLESAYFLHSGRENLEHEKEVIERAAKRLKSSGAFDDKRGLERWCSQRSLFSRCLTICHVKTEVFLEQASQIVGNKPDQERLATVYEEASAPSIRFARLLAIVDSDSYHEEEGPTSKL